MPTRITHHTEQTLTRAIHRLARRSSILRVAVAYCGREAYTFFPEVSADRPEDLRVLIDASEPAVKLGLTNPEGIEHLLGLNATVKSLPGLHAKVLLFSSKMQTRGQAAALVGSTNLSGSSLDQYQMTLEVSDMKVIQRLVTWFDALWGRGSFLDSHRVSQLKALKPKHRPRLPRIKKKKIPPVWRRDVPQPPPDPWQFTYDKDRMMDLLKAFRDKEECPYFQGKGMSCLDAARAAQQEHAQLATKLRSVMRRRSHWKQEDLQDLFDLAFHFGQAAHMRKPAFTGQSPAKVAKSINFLLNGDGDPYARVEKLLAPRSHYKLKGLGEAGVAFLMHLWRPKEFAIINEPVDDALRILRFDFGRAASRLRDNVYRDRTAAIKHIAEQTNLKPFARVDHFLDAIGKRHIR